MSGVLRDYLRSINQGTTLGFGDELVGGLGATVAALHGDDFSKAYHDIRDNERSEHQRFQDDNPVGAIAGEIGGSILSGGAIAKLIGKAAGSSKLVSKTLKHPLVQGAVTGTAAGVGNASGNDDATDGIIGGVAGTVATGAVLTGIKGLKLAAKVLGFEKVTKSVADSIIKALRADGLDPKKILGQAGELAERTGKDVSLANIISPENAPNTFRLVNQAAGKSNPAGVSAQVADAASGQKERLASDFAGLTGTNKQSYLDHVDDIIKGREEVAGPLYKKAFANDAPLDDPRLTELFKRPSMTQAMKDAVKVAREKGVEDLYSPATGSLDDIPKHLMTGEVDASGAPLLMKNNVKAYDFLKKQLWDLEQGAKSKDLDPLTGMSKPTEASKAIGGTRRELTKLLDELGPDEYRQARQVYGDKADLLEAASLGYRIFKARPEELRSVKSMRPDEREAFTSGFYGTLQDMAEKHGQNFVDKLAGDSKKLDRLKMVFDDPAKFDDFMSMLKAEGMTSQTAKKVKPAADPGVIQAVLGKLTGPSAKAATGVTGAMLEPASAMPDDIVKRLMSSGVVAPQSTIGARAGPAFSLISPDVNNYNDQQDQSLQ